MSHGILMDVEDLTRADLSILTGMSLAGDQLAISMLNTWMSTLTYEDASSGGLEKLQLVHTKDSSVVATWNGKNFINESGSVVEGVTHFSELHEGFFSNKDQILMTESKESSVFSFSEGLWKLKNFLQDKWYEFRTGDKVFEI